MKSKRLENSGPWAVSSGLLSSGFVWKWMLISLFFHLLAAVFSSGFHHYDEHFCIMEFVNFKMGKTPLDHLASDYTIGNRPWIQIFVLLPVAKALSFVGIESPFVWATSFRIVTALLGWASVVFLTFCSFRWLTTESLQRWSVILMSLLWFLPYLHAHPSAESWGASFFFIGFGLLFLETSRPLYRAAPSQLELSSLRSLAVGIFWGAAFHCRYQLGVSIFFVSAWCLFMGRMRLSRLTAMVLGTLLMIGVGCLIDRWGYGAWINAPWNYFRGQVLEGAVNAGGSDVSPWWDYIWKAITQGAFPLSLIIVAAYFISWIRFPLHPLTAATLPFFIVHSLIGHKETRYIFPIAVVAPLMLLLPLTLRSESWLGIFFNRKAVRVSAKFLAVLNGIFLVISCLRPVRVEIPFYRRVYDRVAGALHFVGTDPYRLANIPGHFYRSPRVELVPHSDFSGVEQALASAPSGKIWLFSPGIELPGEAGPLKDLCRVEYQTIPQWALTPPLRPLVVKTKPLIWGLYECGGKVAE